MKLSICKQAPGPVRLHAVAGASLAALVVSTIFGSGVTTAFAADPPTTSTGIVLGVGANESQRVVSWYSSVGTALAVQVVPTSQLVKGQFPANDRMYKSQCVKGGSTGSSLRSPTSPSLWASSSARCGAVTFPATVAANSVSGGFNAHQTIDGLQENVAYSYRVGAEGSWSPTYAFKTRDFKGDFDFMFFGDPQIGSSGDVAKDTAGWQDTLNVALAADPNTELLVSGGDQVNTANTETQWDGFLAPDKLRQYPLAPTIGNHDASGKAYDQHFWTPNTDRSAPFYTGDPTIVSGGDYWYMYKDVLFIDLNSSAYANGADAAHLAFVTDVVKAHGAHAKYTVLVYHHSIYSPADHANDTDIQTRRLDFPTAFSKLGVDLVLQGHDHGYSRSYAIKDGAKANVNEQPGADQVAEGPGGVIYVTANSSSGSKYYELTAPDTTADPNYGPDPLNPNSHWANSVENQENVRTYVKVEVKKDKLVVENIRSGTCAAPNAAVELGNVSSCGPNSGASPAQPVGSTVDKVVIHPSRGRGALALPTAGQHGSSWLTQKGGLTLTALS